MSEMEQVTVEHGGFRIDSNSGSTGEAILANLNPPKEESKEKEEKPDLSKAASDLGKKGGEAAAKKRAEERKSLKAEGSEGGEPDEEEQPEEKASKEPTAKEETEETPKEALGKPRHDPKARMLEATRKEAEAKRDAAKAREEARAVAAERDTLRRELEAAKAPPKAPETTGKPSRVQFQSDEDYFEALADFKAEERVSKYKAERETEERVKSYAQSIDDQLGKAVAARKEYDKIDPGFMDRVSDEVKAVAFSPSFARDMHEPLEPKHIVSDEMIRADKVHPLLLLHFTDNPKEFERILNLDSISEVQVEMRLLARTLKGPATTATVPESKSKALPPVRPVTGAPHNIAEEGHTPERAARGGLDDYARGWKPAKRR